jgi:hyperosmotically inducible protein
MEKIMKSGETRPIRQVTDLAIAGVLALSLVACGEQPSAERIGKGSDGAAPPAQRPLDQGTDTAAGKLDQAERVAGDYASKGGKAIDDATLAALVKSALIAEPGLKALSIDVETTGGVVTLRGTADSANDGEKAVRVASQVRGVKAVENKMMVVKG